MKIEKVNDHQIRCTLTKADLADRELKISELAYGTEKAKSLFRDMMYGLSIIGRRRNLEKMNKDLPIYFMSGDKDPVGGNGVQVAKVYSMFIRAGMRDVFYKFYKDGRHEMLNETNRDEVYNDILNWLFKKLG